MSYNTSVHSVKEGLKNEYTKREGERDRERGRGRIKTFKCDNSRYTTYMGDAEEQDFLVLSLFCLSGVGRMGVGMYGSELAAVSIIDRYKNLNTQMNCKPIVMVFVSYISHA